MTTPDDENADSYGPALPPEWDDAPAKPEPAKRSIGPQIPAHLLTRFQAKDAAGDEDQDTNANEPADDPTPAHSNKKESSEKRPSPGRAPTRMRGIGPAMPGADDEDEIGPMPYAPGANGDNDDDDDGYNAHTTQQRKEDTASNVVKGREDWMTQLPTNRSNLDLLGVSRRFGQTTVRNQDTSVWTDSPAEREKKALERRQQAMTKPEKRAPEPKQPEIQNLRKEKSLLETHQEKLKKQKIDTTYQPFDRERDILNKKVDSSVVQKLVTDSSNLHSRFASKK